jgi:hypothetical protein
MKASLLILCVFLTRQLSMTTAYQVYVYEDTLHKGKEALIEGDTCQNMKDIRWSRTCTKTVNDDIRSVNTKDTCAVLYEHEDCEGASIMVKPGSPYHYDLSRLDFNDRASSIGPCYI